MRPIEMKNSYSARVSGCLFKATTYLLVTGLIGALLAAQPAANPRKEIVDALKSDHPVQRQAAATLLGDLSMDSPDVREKGRFASVNPDEFVTTLAQMADKDPDPQVREAAVTALGKMRPDLAKVLAPLSDVLLNKGNKRGVEERRSAADALASLVRRAVPNEFPRGTIEKAGDNELTVKLDEERKRTFVVTPDTRITSTKMS